MPLAFEKALEITDNLSFPAAFYRALKTLGFHDYTARLPLMAL
jgi:hypothetical protein